MPKNRLEDLNNLLFEQIQNLVDPEKETDVKEQISKAKAVAELASVIVDGAKTQVQYCKVTNSQINGSFFNVKTNNNQLLEIKPNLSKSQQELNNEFDD